MKILTPVLLSLALVLTGCATAPQGSKVEGVRAALNGVPEANLRAQPEEAKVSARFNMTGHTIIGAALVAGAMAKMESQTKELVEMVADYNRKHPEVPTLQAAFNTELESALKARGLAFNPVAADRVSGNKLPAQYVLAEGAASQGPTVVIDDLNARYHAVSSTDAYAPHSYVLVTVMEGTKTRQEYVFDDMTGKGTGSSYANFNAMRTDFPNAYQGLLANVRSLAQRTAEALLASK